MSLNVLFTFALCGDLLVHAMECDKNEQLKVAVQMKNLGLIIDAT